MKMNKTLKIAVPVMAGVLAVSTGVGIAFAKGAEQGTQYQTVANYAPNPSKTLQDSTPVAYCGGWGGVMNWGAGQGLATPQLANLLGLTVADLQAQLSAGKTLAELAAAKGVTSDQVIQTMMGPFSDEMALMLKYGYLSQDEVNAMTQRMQTGLQSLMTSNISDDDPWDFMDEMMQGYFGGTGGGYYGGMMGGWNYPSEQPGTAPQQPGSTIAPRGGFGGMMGSW